MKIVFEKITIYQSPLANPKWKEYEAKYDPELIKTTRHDLDLDDQVQNKLIIDQFDYFKKIDQILAKFDLEANLKIDRNLMITMTFIDGDKSFAISSKYANLTSQPEWLNQNLYQQIKQIVDNLDDWEFFNLNLDTNIYQNDRFLNWKMPKHLSAYQPKDLSIIHKMLIQYCYYFLTFYDNYERFEINHWIELIVQKLKLKCTKTMINHKYNGLDFTQMDLDQKGNFTLYGIIDWGNEKYQPTDFKIKLSAKGLLRMLRKTAYEGPLGSYLNDVDWNQLETFELPEGDY